MLILKGKCVFSDIAIGPMALFHRNTVSTAAHHIEDVEAEKERFHQARQEAIEQLKELYDKALERVGEDEAAVFGNH